MGQPPIYHYGEFVMPSLQYSKDADDYQGLLYFITPVSHCAPTIPTEW